MSDNYVKVKRYYDEGAWSVQRVHNAVGKWITEQEYEEITGFEYPATE